MNYSYFILLFLIGFWGASIGSFALCTAQRLEEGASLFKRSQCEACEKPLGPLQLIPLFSYLFQKGKCVYCESPFSPNYLYAELFLTIFAMLGFWKWGLSLDFIIYFIFLHFFGIIIFSDLLIKKIPMFASLGVGVLGLLKISLTGTYSYVLSSVIAVPVVWVIQRAITKFKHQKSLGEGDLLLIGVCAIWLAPKELPYFAMGIGGLGLIMAFIWHKKFKEARFPFAPAILLGMVLTKMI
ncbi:Prepilin peptidase [Candidatus Bealeia paramacronuclearis]|uniref:Prepilin peptidase n=1 Tax=Candidatus Bealeia paramacronuclearis TaxID=1921001 RepID=A0ABZ2C4T2_9PROT|nr:Prepilin peptidase [Candidatus Bealeia paramacronuclearis]